jgi:hypothetical protein
MRSLFDKLGRAGLAYGTTALAQIGALFCLKALLPVDQLVLAMQFLFFSQMLAGIDPATVKADLLQKTASKSQRFNISAAVYVPIVKAIAVALVIGPAWFVSFPSTGGFLLIASWALALACVGFATTEFRTALDAVGCYGAGLWLKQGGLSLGAIVIVATVYSGASWDMAATLSIAARIFWLLLFYKVYACFLDWSEGIAKLFSAYWMDQRWMHIAGASILSAISGSVDRWVAFQYFSPQETAFYVLLFEIFSKFWLISYVAAPIVFSEYATKRDGPRLFKQTTILISACGFAMLVFSLVILGLQVDWVAAFFSYTPTLWPTLAFVASVILSALTQLGIARLQGLGLTGQASNALMVGMIFTVPLFWWSAMMYGMAGLLTAWLVKALVEFCLIFLKRRNNVNGF